MSGNLKDSTSKGRAVKKYFIVFGITMLILLIFYGLGLGAYLYLKVDTPAYVKENQEKEWERSIKISKEEVQKEELGIDVPLRTNFLLIGRDKIAGLTDTIIAATFKADTGELFMISIPRDLYTVLERDKINELKEHDRHPPSYFKINSLYNYAGGGELGIKYLKEEVSEIIGVNFDFYIMIDTAGFREVVDAIGGIDFDVPKRLYYNDPGQNLYIDLYPGMQHLNGKQAEGLVRYRKGYADQDITRMKTQQEFLKVFLETVLSKENLRNNLSSLANSFMQYVETDITVGDISKYINIASSIDTSKVKSSVLPSEGGMIDGAYYFEIDEEEAKKVIDEYFFDISEEQTSEMTTGGLINNTSDENTEDGTLKSTDKVTGENEERLKAYSEKVLEAIQKLLEVV